MDIEVFALCDAATDSGGKLNLLGAFDSIVVESVPVVHPQCAVALRLRVSQMEAGEHSMKINIVNDDGKPVVPELNAKINSLLSEVESKPEPTQPKEVPGDQPTEANVEPAPEKPILRPLVPTDLDWSL